jgi:hypothetical protein
MKRIATIGAIVTAFAVAPTVAAAGNVTQVKLQNQKPQVVDVQVAQVQRAQVAVSMQRQLVQVAKVQRALVAVSLQRQLVQVAHAKRYSVLVGVSQLR